MDKSLMTKEKSSLMNNYSRLPITFVKGEGSFVWDEHGDKFLDFTSGMQIMYQFAPSLFALHPR